MAADHEIRLVSKAIRDADLNTLINAGIEPDWFVNTDARDVWRWLLAHRAKYGDVASPASVKAEFPAFTLLRVTDSLDYLVDKFVEYRRAVKITDTVQEAASILGETNDHEAALQFIEQQITIVHRESAPGTSDMDLTKDALDRFKAYEEAEARGGGAMLGLPTGFEKIDEATAGLQGGQLITLIAMPKTGKSTGALQMATNMHTLDKRIMFQSFEMSNTEQQVRHDAMRAKISHTRLRTRSLIPAEKQRYRAMLRSLGSAGAPLILTDSLHGRTVSALAAKIDQTEPDIAFVDGVYLMTDEQSGESNTPQALTNITRSLKELSQRLDIPLVISTQTLPWKSKGGKVSAEAIGYSSSFFQDSDVILGLQRVEDDEESRELLVVESRNCGRESTTLIWRWDTGCFHDDTPEATASCPGCAVAAHFGPALP